MYVVVSKLYNLFMTTISITEARADLAAVVKKVKKTPVEITSHGKVQAVLVDPSFYERAMEALEDLEDVRAFDEAMEDKSPGIPWEKVKKELGI